MGEGIIPIQTLTCFISRAASWHHFFYMHSVGKVSHKCHYSICESLRCNKTTHHSVCPPLKDKGSFDSMLSLQSVSTKSVCSHQTKVLQEICR